VIYVDLPHKKHLHLLLCYTKSDQENLTSEQARANDFRNRDCLEMRGMMEKRLFDDLLAACKDALEYLDGLLQAIV